MKPSNALRDIWKIKEELYREKEREGLSTGQWLDEVEKRADEFIKRSGYRVVEVAPGQYKITR